MSRLTAQFALIAKIKSLVKSTGISFLDKKDDSAISEKIALKIQKNSYELSNKVEKDSYTPTYKQIAEQLQVGEDQIFRAAVRALSKIAKNREVYREEIIKLLQASLSESYRTPEQIDYVNQKIGELSNKKAA